MKDWLLYAPKDRGALLGSLAIGFVRFLWICVLLALDRGTSLTDMFDQVSTAAIYSLPGFVWGSVLGCGIGMAFRDWDKGDADGARFLCKLYGGVCALALGLWAIFALWILTKPTLYSKSFITSQYQVCLSYLLVNTPLQAAILTFAAGSALPKNQERMVQVTEKLRM